MEYPRRSQHRPPARVVRGKQGVKATFFVLGWVTREVARADPPHPRRRPRNRLPRPHARARLPPDAGSVPRGDAASRRACSKTLIGAPVDRLPRGELFDHRANRCGRSTSCAISASATTRASFRSRTIATAFPVRRPRPGPIAAPNGKNIVEFPLSTKGVLGHAHARRGRRIFPALAVLVHALGAASVNIATDDALRFLSASVGDRSGAAARQGEPALALPPLQQPGRMRGAAARAARRLPLHDHARSAEPLSREGASHERQAVLRAELVTPAVRRYLSTRSNGTRSPPPTRPTPSSRRTNGSTRGGRPLARAGSCFSS